MKRRESVKLKESEESFDPFHLIHSFLYSNKTYVKFDGSESIDLRNFACFVVDFFSTDRTFVTKLLIRAFPDHCILVPFHNSTLSLVLV